MLARNAERHLRENTKAKNFAHLNATSLSHMLFAVMFAESIMSGGRNQLRSLPLIAAQEPVN
jgi:hypothetical protein